VGQGREPSHILQISSIYYWKSRGEGRVGGGGEGGAQRSSRPGCGTLALFLATICVETSNTATATDFDWNNDQLEQTRQMFKIASGAGQVDSWLSLCLFDARSFNFRDSSRPTVRKKKWRRVI
jgi:hypothetical protein